MKLNMTKNKYPGRLITFCGLDGCGKTTMIRMLNTYLQQKGYNIFLTKQPTDFVRQSPLFRNFMDEVSHDGYDYRSLSLFAASDRLQHTKYVIEPQLAQGNIVISDRYFYSCLANLQSRGYRKDQWIYEVVAPIIEPDLAFFLDLDVEKAVERVRERSNERDSYIDMPLQYALREAYLKIAAENDGVVLSSDKNPQECFRQVIREFVKRILMERIDL